MAQKNSPDYRNTGRMDITDLLTASEKQDILDTVKSTNSAYNRCAILGIRHKTDNAYALDKIINADEQIASNPINRNTLQLVRDSACGAIKSFRSNHPKRGWKMRLQKTTLSYPLGVPHTLKEIGKNKFKFSTNHRGARITVCGILPDWFVKAYPERKLCTGTVSVTDRGRFFLNLTYSVPRKVCEADGELAIDKGWYHITASSRGGLHPTKHYHAVERRYAYTEDSLKSKGTRSAKKRLKARKGKERRFRLDEAHCISKALACDDSVSTLYCEDLHGIYRNDRGKWMNRMFRQVAWANLDFDLEYKFSSRGKKVVKVNPYMTSQACPICSPWTRRKDGKWDYVKGDRNGKHFHCPQCGFTAHADVSASLNILKKGRVQSISSTRLGGAGRVGLNPTTVG